MVIYLRVFVRRISAGLRRAVVAVRLAFSGKGVGYGRVRARKSHRFQPSACLDVELVVFASLVVYGIRVEYHARADTYLVEHGRGHGQVDVAEIQGICQQVVARTQGQLVDELYFLFAFSGGVAEVSDLGFEIVSYGQADASRFASRRRRIDLPGVYVVFMRFLHSELVYVIQSPPAVEVRAFFRTVGK